MSWEWHMLRHASDFYPKTRELNREPFGVSPNAESMIHWGGKDKIKPAYEQRAISSSLLLNLGNRRDIEKERENYINQIFLASLIWDILTELLLWLINTLCRIWMFFGIRCCTSFLFLKYNKNAYWIYHFDINKYLWNGTKIKKNTMAN